MGLHLVVGNKNYSSWSLRPWLAMKVAGIAFAETVISLDAPDFKSRVTAVSGAGRVPGPFLYGAFGAADAMYAPVVWRFHTYAVEVSAVARVYMRTLMELPAWSEWRAAELREPWTLPRNEVD